MLIVRSNATVTLAVFWSSNPQLPVRRLVDDSADSREINTSKPHDLPPVSFGSSAGTNTLAIKSHQNRYISSDVCLTLD